MNHTPITILLEAEKMGEALDFSAMVGALARPMTCRFVTNGILERGIHQVLDPLAGAFQRFLDGPAPLVHKRYVARFLYNLVLTHCAFDVGEKPSSGRAKMPNRHKTLLYTALHRLRSDLGADHLFSDEVLASRSEFFVVPVMESGEGIEELEAKATAATQDLKRKLRYI
jgi:hypothetical protein